MKSEPTTLKSLIDLLKFLVAAACFAIATYYALDFALNAKADTEGYYNALGTELLPYQVLPYRIIAFLSIPFLAVGVLICLVGAALAVFDVVCECKIYIKKLFKKLR